MNRGFYVLLITIHDEMIVKRGKKVFHLIDGEYLYVGCAMNSLSGRVKYHLSPRKSGKWHVDEILGSERAKIELAILVPSERRLEEDLSIRLSTMKNTFDVVKGFGSSDVKTEGNLFRILNLERALKTLLILLLDVKKGSDKNDSLLDGLGEFTLRWNSQRSDKEDQPKF